MVWLVLLCSRTRYASISLALFTYVARLIAVVFNYLCLTEHIFNISLVGAALHRSCTAQYHNTTKDVPGIYHCMQDLLIDCLDFDPTHLCTIYAWNTLWGVLSTR